jgi:hypothetical protein
MQIPRKPTDFDPYSRVFARSFLLSSASADQISFLCDHSPVCGNLQDWQKTYFGKYRLWHDPRLRFGLSRDDAAGVGILGLCIHTAAGLSDNESIAAHLHDALSVSENTFFDQVDELTGTFAILYRLQGRVFVLQDAAACKSVYFHSAADGAFSVSNNATLLAYLHALPPNPDCDIVWSNEDYKHDPSRYLPGLITPFTGVFPLTGNHALDCDAGKSKRFFPRRPNETLALTTGLIDEVTDFFLRQAALVGCLRRPLWLATTGGRDSRVTAAIFASQPRLRYFSFHMPSINHLTEDVRIAARLAEIAKVPLSVFELEHYRDSAFTSAFQMHSRRGIWPAAAQCYCSEFEDDAIHLRSTVSEIGRIFYSNRTIESTDPVNLARTYTSTPFQHNPLVLHALDMFAQTTNFSKKVFYNYNMHDMFYWEHRNAKWQNVLCAEAEMACDVFVPYNNRWLLNKMMALPYPVRLKADIHREVWKQVLPEFDSVAIA